VCKHASLDRLKGLFVHCQCYSQIEIASQYFLLSSVSVSSRWTDTLKAKQPKSLSLQRTM